MSPDHNLTKGWPREQEAGGGPQTIRSSRSIMNVNSKMFTPVSCDPAKGRFMFSTGL